MKLDFAPVVTPDMLRQMGTGYLQNQGMEASNALTYRPMDMPSGSFNAPQMGFGQKAMNWLGDGNNLGTVMQGIGGLTSAYLGFKQLGQAKEALNLQKEAFRTNLANSTKSYNTSLEDRIRGRSANPNESDVQAYLAKHSLRNKP